MQRFGDRRGTVGFGTNLTSLKLLDAVVDRQWVGPATLFFSDNPPPTTAQRWPPIPATTRAASHRYSFIPATAEPIHIPSSNFAKSAIQVSNCSSSSNSNNRHTFSRRSPFS
ncbi:hypothetical protein L6452_28156 [Arctium lappa]|uniref:Uncharacterized protein n=1 Tax=Arctium lappa TaxID=4217 RepID=A0ACB8ZXP6_ARCLA|nr:hypothetical protein L6452_28156 [Arctium lappa]